MRWCYFLFGIHFFFSGIQWWITGSGWFKSSDSTIKRHVYILYLCYWYFLDNHNICPSSLPMTMMYCSHDRYSVTWSCRPRYTRSSPWPRIPLSPMERKFDIPNEHKSLVTSRQPCGNACIHGGLQASSLKEKRCKNIIDVETAYFLLTHFNAYLALRRVRKRENTRVLRDSSFDNRLFTSTPCNDAGETD